MKLEDLRGYLLVRCSRLHPTEHVHAEEPERKRPFQLVRSSWLGLQTSWAPTCPPRLREFARGQVGDCAVAQGVAVQSRACFLCCPWTPCFSPRGSAECGLRLRGCFRSLAPEPWAAFSLPLFVLSCCSDARGSSSPSRNGGLSGKSTSTGQSRPAEIRNTIVTVPVGRFQTGLGGSSQELPGPRSAHGNTARRELGSVIGSYPWSAC